MTSNMSFWLSVNGRAPVSCSTSETIVRRAISAQLNGMLDDGDYYIIHNGRLVQDTDEVTSMLPYNVIPRILGGKGGFGSMLRALGAQIEKTTNREACRDLSGRRMRDVNNEKRLREWVANSGERDRAKEERRKERRERMKAPQYNFVDPEHDEVMRTNREKLDLIMEKGLKEKLEEEAKESKGKGLKRKAVELDMNCKKTRGWLGIDVDAEMDDASSSSESSDTDNTSEEVGQCASSTHSHSPTSAVDNFASHSLDTPSTSTASNDQTDQPIKLEEGCSSTTQGVDQVDSIASTSNESTALSTNDQQTNASVKLEDCSSIDEIEVLGMDVLKNYLLSRGVKCGGTLQERAQRVFLIKDLEISEIHSSLLAKPTKKK